MPTKTFPVSACMPVIYSGGSGMNPGDLHLPVGEWAAGLTGWNTRALLKASISFSGMTAINEARLYLYQHTAASWHAKGSGTSTLDTRRKTSDWSEASGGSSTATDEVYGGSSGSLVSGGFADEPDALGSINNAAADGALDYIPLTHTVRAWYEGAPNYGVMLLATGTSSADAAEFYSRRQSGRVPYFWIDYETNTTPLAPYGLAPSEITVHTGRTITYSGTRNDVDAGDYLSAYEITVYLTDRTTLLQTYNSGTLSGSPLSFSKALTLPSGYNANREYSWRARTRDRASVWGPWSPFHTFRANTVPATPAAPTVEGDSRTPLISGAANDNDPGDSCDAVQIEVERVSPAADMWSSPNISIAGSPWSATYAGSALSWAVQYRARHRARDTFGAFSSWSAWRTFTPTQPVGPDNLTPRSTATKQQTLTPTLTVGHSAAFTNHAAEVYAGSTTSSAKLWTAPVVGDYAAATSKPLTYAGTALAWGAVYYWRAQVKVGGTMSAWSPLVPFYVNAEPSAPAELAARSLPNMAPVVTGGVYVVTTTTPQLEAVFGDPDLDAYGDRPSSRTVEIYVRNADGSPGASKHANTLPAPPYSEPMTYAVPGAAALAIGSDYLVRWRFADNAARPSPYSAYMTLRLSAAPVVALVSPPAAAVVTDSTPLLDWTFTGAAGKAQTAFQVMLFETGIGGVPHADGELLVHDSGIVASSATSYQLPPQIVLDGRSYRWQVYALDADNLLGILS